MSGLAGQTSLFPPEPAPDPLLCWLWLAHVLGPASVHAGRVLDAFGGAQEAWEARDTAEFRLAAGEAAALRAQQLAPEQYHPLVMRCDDLGVRILPFDDPDYPLAFSRIPDMPLVLYCTGDPLWLNEPGAVGIVGSRKPTEYGLNAAADIGGELAQSGALIVSGLADGLDSAGHRAAVKNNCPTIAVMGVPIDRTYPAANVVLRHKIEQNDVYKRQLLVHPFGGPLRRLAGDLELPFVFTESEIMVTVQEAQPEPETPEQEPEAAEPVPADPALVAQLQEGFAWRYPAAKLAAVPAKVSVTSIVHKAEQTTLERPAFLSKDGLTAAEMGTALHIITFTQTAGITFII